MPSMMSDRADTSVLSWNINGSTRRGMAALRNVLVPEKVWEINPSVMLLQEPATRKLVNRIKSRFRECICSETQRKLCCLCGKNQRNFISVEAGKWKQSQIVYDSNIYIDISNEKIFPFEDDYICVKDALWRSIDCVIPPEYEINEIFFERLRRDEKSVPERAVIFISYHNVHNKCRLRDGRRCNVTEELARDFCQVVDELQELTGAVVVAGADLNCDIENFEDLKQAYKICRYTPTLRRVRKIDFMLVATPHELSEHTAALDFMPSNDDTLNTLHGIIREVFPRGRNVAYNIWDYCGRAVDHDPIVCDLQLHRKL